MYTNKIHFEKDKNDIWQCISVAKTFLFNINLELQKSDENWRRNNTLKSAHTVKKQLWEKRKWSEIPALRLIEHCQATLEWTDFLWLNAFSSAQYYGGLFETNFLFIFKVHAPLKDSCMNPFWTGIELLWAKNNYNILLILMTHHVRPEWHLKFILLFVHMHQVCIELEEKSYIHGLFYIH